MCAFSQGDRKHTQHTLRGFRGNRDRTDVRTVRQLLCDPRAVLLRGKREALHEDRPDGYRSIVPLACSHLPYHSEPQEDQRRRAHQRDRRGTCFQASGLCQQAFQHSLLQPDHPARDSRLGLPHVLYIQDRPQLPAQRLFDILRPLAPHRDGLLVRQGLQLPYRIHAFLR